MEAYQTSFSLGDESSQMWTLNKRLEAYLSRVKALEEENEILRAEIHHLRKESKVPSVRKYHEEIMKLRDALDEGHQKMVEVEMARDNIYQEIEFVKDLCLQEKQAQEEAKKEMSESKKILEEEKRAQNWLKEKLVQLEEEIEDILRVHEEEKAAMEEEISRFSRRLDSFKVAPVAFQPINLEDYSIKLSQIWQGAVEDYKSEVASLESGLSEAKENLRKVLEENKQSKIQLQSLEKELQSLKSRKEMLEDVLEKQWLDQHEEEGRLQLEIETLDKEKQDLRAQIAQVLEDRQQLMHLKMSLSLEVATYRSLLEAESTRAYSPAADYKLSFPFSESRLERTPLRKRQAESIKTPVARDYRQLTTKKQSVEKSEQLLHTPSRHLNVKSTSFTSRASPVTKEFQKVSSVLQSQSLKYTKASTDKAATTLPSVERKTERCPPSEDAFEKRKVETIAYSYSQSPIKASTDITVRSETKDKPQRKSDEELTKTETVENGFLLPGEKEILDAQLKTDNLESSLKTVKDDHLTVLDTALEVDINVQDSQSKDKAPVEKINVQQTEFGILSQDLEEDLVVEKEEVVTEIVKCQTVLLEKQEVMQSLEYQNIETSIKEEDEDHRKSQAISEPYSSDAKAELPTHEQESSLTSTERVESEALSSDVLSQYEPVTQQEQDVNAQVSFDLEKAISDIKEEATQWADENNLLVNQGFEIINNTGLEKVETESEQIIEDQGQEEQKLVGQSDIKDEIIFDSPESFEKCSDDALGSDEVIVSQEISSLSSEIDNNRLLSEEEFKTESKELQEDFDLHLVQSKSLPDGSKDSTDTMEQELSDIKKEIQYFEEEEVKSDVEESSQEHPTEQSSETYTKEEFVSLHQDKQITEQFIVDNKEVIDHLDDAQSENIDLPETGLEEIQKELETTMESNGKEQEISDILSTDEGTQIAEDKVEITKLESEDDISQLEDAAQDTVQLIEQIEDSYDDKLEEQKISEPRDVVQDQSNLEQEIDNQLSGDNQILLNDQDTTDSVQLLNDTDDSGQSEDKSQEQPWEDKQETNNIPEAEPVDSLQSFQEEQKDIDLPENEQQDVKLSPEHDSSSLENKETTLAAEDVIEEPKSDEQTSLSFDESAENEVNAIVEEFGEMKQDSTLTFSEKEDLIPDEVKSLESQVPEEGDVLTETDSAPSLQKEVVEQPAEKDSEPCIEQDITDAQTVETIVQENQPEEQESEKLFTKANETEESIQRNESKQEIQDLADSVACALLREELELESSLSTDGVQEAELSYEQVENVQSKITFQSESETQWTEKVIVEESSNILSTSAELTFSEEHEVDTQLVHKECDPTEEEESTVTSQEPERPLPENSTEECISESENIESEDFIPISQETKGPAADPEPEVDHESLRDTQTEIIFQKDTIEEYNSKDTQEETHDDNYEDVLKEAEAIENEEESKDSVVEQEPEHDQQQVTTILEQECTGEYSSQVTEEEINQDKTETTALDSLVEIEDNKEGLNPEVDQETELSQEDVSDSNTFNQESVEIPTAEGTEEKSEVSGEIVYEAIEKEASEENEGNNTDFGNSETDQEPERDDKSLFSAEAKITSEQESVLDLDRGSDEEINKESCEIVSRMVENVFSEKTEFEAVEVDESAIASTEVKMEECISGSENVESAPVSQESQDPEPDQKPELEQELLSDIQKEIALQQEYADEYSSSGVKEQTSQDDLETVTKITEQDITEEEEQDSKVFKAYEDQVLAEEPIFDTEPQFTPQQSERLGFSETTEEEINQETEEVISKTAEHDITVEHQEDNKDARDSEPEQGQELVGELQFTSQQIEETSSSTFTEEAVSEETDEEASKTAEQDKEIEEESKQSDNNVIQETEVDFDQYTEAKATSQSEIEEGQIKQSGEEKEESNEAAEACDKSVESEDIALAQKEPEGQIPFSLSIIQNNLRFTSENDSEVPPEKQECELSSEELEADEKGAISEDLQNDETEDRKEIIVSEPFYQDSTFSLEPNDQIQEHQEKFLEHEKVEQKGEQHTDIETERPTEEQSEIADAHAHSNLDDENSKSDESLDSQDISIYSQRSDLEISKDYQLEQTLPDSTPLPNLDDDFEDLAEEIIKSEEAQNVVASQFLPEPNEEVLDDSLESQSSQIIIEPEIEELKQDSGDFSQGEPTFDNKQLKDSDIVKEENENTESDESLNSQEEVLISSQSDNLQAITDYQLESLPDTTPLSNQNIESDFSAEKQMIFETEPISLNQNQSDLVTEEFAVEQSTELVTDNKETEDVIVISDHTRDLTQDQSSESNEVLKDDFFEPTNDEPLHESEAELQHTELPEHTQDDTKTLETSDNSISSDDTSPNVTAIADETGAEDVKSVTEESFLVKESSDEFAKVDFETVEETQEDKTLPTTESGQEAHLPEHLESHASDEEKDTTGEISDSSFDSNSGNEREAAEDKYSLQAENIIHVKTVNGLHENTTVQATFDLDDLVVNGHSTGEQTSEGKSEGLFQSLLEKSELNEGSWLDEASKIKKTIHTTVEYVDPATDESNYTKKTLNPYLTDTDFSSQTEIKPLLVAEDIIVDKDTNQQTFETHQVKEESWSSDE
uniref:IF rod domain-containing protein n=1 Tax=Pyxicephalus adspersus TaxID=30357 RepID=A0AAV2ZQC8_PYXAD|nr:TPA: hypothetical protein GDO54_005014 [Pyxicephalus adspersus]